MLVTIAVTLHTIGHGTRSIEEFVATLHGASIARVVDVRAFPRSRTNPQFDKDVLAQSLAAAGIEYVHRPTLGGRRRGLGNVSPNVGWQQPAFRAYADHMLTDVFWSSVDELLAEAEDRPTAIMCSETLWWRCHRRLIADAATARGATVTHLMKPGTASAHTLSPPARVVGRRVVYTSEDDQRSGSR
jgi:uncharacterized protein (DUF488 family)